MSAPIVIFWSLVFGIQLLNLCTPRRRGDCVRCAQCEYQQAPAGPISERCPECGAAWLERGAVVYGEKIPYSVQFRERVPYVVASLLAALLLLPTIGRTQKFVPSTMLIPDLRAGAGLRQLDAFDELTNRALSPGEVRAVADALLAERNNRGYLQPQMDAWLVKRTLDGTLPREYLGNLWECSVQLEHFASIEQDGSRSVLVHFLVVPNARAFGLTSAPAQVVAFGGFYVGDNDAPQQRSNRAFSVRPTSTSRSVTPSMTFVGQPGDAAVRVRAVVWNILLPAGSTLDAITWLDDGTPHIPPDALWSERVELETMVEF